MNPDHLTILEFLGWKRDGSKWENPSKAIYGADAPALSLDLAHEAEGKFTDEQHAIFRDLLKSIAARDFDLEPERAYVSADASDRRAAIVATIAVIKEQEAAAVAKAATDAEKAEESTPAPSEEPETVPA